MISRRIPENEPLQDVRHSALVCTGFAVRAGSVKSDPVFP